MSEQAGDGDEWCECGEQPETANCGRCEHRVDDHIYHTKLCVLCDCSTFICPTCRGALVP